MERKEAAFAGGLLLLFFFTAANRGVDNPLYPL